MKHNESQYDNQERTTISNRMIILVSILNLFFLIFTSSFAFNESMASICARGLMFTNIAFLMLFMIKSQGMLKNYLLF